MRVIAGTAKGTPLLAVEGDYTRPILDRVKESLFSMISNDIIDANILDLFAGTGGLGIEALSRGAKSCLFVEDDFCAVDVIKKNLAKSNLADNSKIITTDVFRIDENIEFNRHIAGNTIKEINSMTSLNDESSSTADNLQFDVVLVGVPYVLFEQDETRDELLQLFKRFVEKQILSVDGFIVLQHKTVKFDIPDAPYKLKIFDARVYGKTQLTFFQPL